ncbi:MAG: MBL fold metallo-hydrolase [Acidobacteria bacterium]|nr:MBL fold metallo-hydrolase [Acidobacteriota bacterium]
MRAAMIGAAAALLLAGGTSVLAQGGPDYSQIEIKTTKVGGSLFVLEGIGGNMGGNISVLAGPDGAFMVDAAFAPLSAKILAAVKAVQPDGRIRFLVNTHLHGDHTGGNENMARAGATLLSRESLRRRLATPGPTASGQPGTPAPAAALAVLTYDAPVTVHVNGDDVQLIPVPNAHTDGDTMIYFPSVHALAVGDFYRSTGYPNIDRSNGGTMDGMLAGFEAIARVGGPDLTIIPGHGPLVGKAQVAAHRAMMMAVRDKVAALIEAGKTQEEVVAAKPTAEFDAKVPGATPQSADRFVAQVYQELKK